MNEEQLEAEWVPIPTDVGVLYDEPAYMPIRSTYRRAVEGHKASGGFTIHPDPLEHRRLLLQGSFLSQLLQVVYGAPAFPTFDSDGKLLLSDFQNATIYGMLGRRKRDRRLHQHCGIGAIHLHSLCARTPEEILSEISLRDPAHYVEQIVPVNEGYLELWRLLSRERNIDEDELDFVANDYQLRFYAACAGTAPKFHVGVRGEYGSRERVCLILVGKDCVAEVVFGCKEE